MTTLAKIAIVLVAAALPPASSAFRGDPGPLCATDGVAPGPVLRIRAETGDGPRVFCSVGCAERWLAAFPDAADRWVVADEVSGDEVDAGHAWFVRSRVATLRASGETIHAFATEDGAEAHAAAHGGRVLRGASRPLGRGGRP